MLERLFDRIAIRLIIRATRTPYEHIGQYMERYWLVPYADPTPGNGCGPVAFRRRPLAWLLQRLGIAVRVHRIRQSDDDRAFHDHPWHFATLILSGGYLEATPVFDRSGIYTHTVVHGYYKGSLRFMRARAMHRLEMIPGEEAWTLFITGPKRQAWGFLPAGSGKVYWRDYLSDLEEQS